MPARSKHLAFDEMLREKGVIMDDTDGTTVHNRLDRHARTYGPNHREEDEWHSHVGVRSMTDNLLSSFGNISKERATDYVRIAHGHECLDYMASKLRRQYDCSYAALDWDEVFRRTWRYMKSKGYDRSYYRELG